MRRRTEMIRNREINLKEKPDLSSLLNVYSRTKKKEEKKMYFGVWHKCKGHSNNEKN